MFNWKSILLFIALTGIAACSTQKKQPNGPQDASNSLVKGNYSALDILLAHNWKLTTLNGKSIQQNINSTSIGFAFDENKQRVSGFSGCNQFSGSFIATESNLTFKQMLSTQMACGEVDKIEWQFLKTLAETTSYKTANGILQLIDKNKHVVAILKISDKL